MRENGATLKCKVFNGSQSLTMHSHVASLTVHSKEETMETTEEDPYNRQTEFYDTMLPTQSLTTPTPISWNNPEPNSPILESAPYVPEGSSTPPIVTEHDNSMTISIGGTVATFFLILLILFILYILVFKERSKSKFKPTHASHTVRDGETDNNEDEIMETQLRGTTPECDQENTATSSAGEKSVESPKETITVVATLDLNWQSAEAKRHEDNVEDGEKKSTNGQKNSEIVYSVVDKRRSETIKSETLYAEDASPKVSGGEKDGTKLEGGDDSHQTLSSDFNTEILTKHQKPTVAVKVFPGSRRVVDRQPSSKTPPKVIPYHLSKRSRAHAHTTTETEATPEQTTTDHATKDDPRQKNVEGLLYADLDLLGGSARIVSLVEKTVYADIVSQETVGKLREGSTGHAPEEEHGDQL